MKYIPQICKPIVLLISLINPSKIHHPDSARAKEAQHTAFGGGERVRVRACVCLCVCVRAAATLSLIYPNEIHHLDSVRAKEV